MLVVEVSQIREFESKSLKGFANVTVSWLGGEEEAIEIEGFRIIQQEGSDAWVAPPQREYTDRDGNKKYVPIVRLSDSLKAKVQEAGLSSWQGKEPAGQSDDDLPF